MISSPDTPAEGRTSVAIEPWVRHLVAIAAALSLGVFIASLRMSVSQEVRLVVPTEVVPGEPFPVRVLVYRDLRAVRGPRLVAVNARARVRDGRGHEGPPVALAPGFGQTLEGQLQAPSAAQDALTVVVDFPDDPDAPLAEVVLATRPSDGRQAPLQPMPRRLRPLQRLSVGPVRGEGGKHVSVPAPLKVAVASGGCVPEVPCDVFVHVDAPTAAVSFAATGSVTPLAAGDSVGDSEAPAVPKGATGPGVDPLLDPGSAPPAVAHLRVLVHGPEAVTELRAHRRGAIIARRSIRLPVLLGVSSLEASEGRLRLRGPPGPCIVDVFSEGRLATSETHADCTAGLPSIAPSASLSRRMQVRHDPFAAASATAFVPVPGTPDAIQRLAAVVARRDPDDGLAESCMRDVTDCPPGAGGYLAARASEGIYAVPRPLSGMVKAVEAVAVQRARLRWATLLSLGLCALTLATLVARRGVSGGAQARAWLAQSEAPPDLERRARLRGGLVIVACVAALLLAFLAVGLYVVARGVGR